MTKALTIAIVGNPNVGKTSLFNALTASRYRVGNYAGVTVERREGALASTWGSGEPLVFVDLPGTYSLTAMSDDEAVAFRSIHGDDSYGPPDIVLVVIDATNLARNLYLVLQLLEQRRPVVVALNMVDVAESLGMGVDADALARVLQVPVVATVARNAEGIERLVAAIRKQPIGPVEPRYCPLPEHEGDIADALRALADLDGARARWLLTSAAAERLDIAGCSLQERTAVAALGPQRVDAAARQLIAARYRQVDAMLAELGLLDAGGDAVTMRFSDRVDRILTHKVWGLGVFVAVMATVFMSIFSWAEPLMTVIERLMVGFAEWVRGAMGPGLLTDLVRDGVVAGVGNVLVFIPQIALLFLCLGLLEDSGYLARAAFLLDRLMAGVGLHGRAFIPLLSGYACAIPAILSTRTISSFRDRVVTILMIPYMSCSARLPVYTLVIAALFVTSDPWISPNIDRGLVLLGMYALSTVSALAIGFLYKRTLLKGPVPPLVLELPPYRRPRLRNALMVVFDRTRDFVRNAGTVILAVTIVLWGLLAFPREATHAGEAGPTDIAQSYAGRTARALEPALEPIGQDWRMGVGLIGSFAAREVLVSTLGLVYGMEADEDDTVELRRALREDVDPETGEPQHTPLSGLALMVFFVYACQCMSTIAVVRRETRSWRWPIFMFVSMTTLAYVAALAVFQVGRALGWT